MTFPDLNTVLEYKNPDVLKLYRQNYPDNQLSAEQAFTELLKYLWISKKHSVDTENCADKVGFGFCSTDISVMLPIECFMPDSMREIDQMWHEFILFTRDYTDFCLRYFGEYLHHRPTTFDDAQVERDLAEREIEKLLTYICDNLGIETVSLWYSSYLTFSPVRSLVVV